MSYWRTYTGIEVDAVVGDARVAIEIKSAEEIRESHLKGLKALSEERPQSRLMAVSNDPFYRRIDRVECMYVKDFLHMMWSEGL